MEIKESARKKAAAIISAFAAAAVIFGGTFAWQSISQKVQNETQTNINPGARLHDDFNGTNKDIYVENFTDENNFGVAVYARIRLNEYMEIGVGAGNPDAPDRKVQVIGKADADIKDPSTWAPHLPGRLNQGEVSNSHIPMHKYWSWEMGGKTIYMPTFNKDKDSLEAEVNGTFAGPDGDKTTDEDRYGDYKEYKLGEEKTDTATYAGGISSNETHQAKETIDAKVITMEEWKAMGAPVGNYWVYDVDGWAYWAQAIQPGEATGLLLSSITPENIPDEESYYSINVTGQFATAGDWGDEKTGTGFYEDGITADGLFVLNQAAGQLPKISYMQVKGGFKQYVKAGDSLDFEIDMDIEHPSGKPSETYVLWKSEPDTPSLNGNTFTPTDRMVGHKYKITAISTYDPNVTAFVDVYVYPREAVGVVNGEMDGKTYVDFGDNTFKEIKDDGSLGEFVCGGIDEKIGNGDDKLNVVVIDPAHPVFGSKFIGPDGYDRYYAVGADGKLGTADDVRVTGNPWPNDITDMMADNIVITTAENKNKAKLGKTLKFNAVVTLHGKEIENQDVTWRVTGNKNAGTTINSSGVLSVNINETIGAVLTVYAASTEQQGLERSINITVAPMYEYEDLPNMPVGTTAYATIDGIEWYLLAKDGNKALLWSKNSIGGNITFGSTSVWKDSTIRTYLNGEFINGLTLLKDKAASTALTTRTQYTASTWETTNDKVFFLSEADLFGTNNGTSTSDPKDYTIGNNILVPDIEMRKFNGASYAWLRSPANIVNPGVAIVWSSGAAGSTMPTHTQISMRPALWVEMP